MGTEVLVMSQYRWVTKVFVVVSQHGWVTKVLVVRWFTKVLVMSQDGSLQRHCVSTWVVYKDIMSDQRY